ncbi:MAG TPA: hypothetical protein VFW40_02425 [Capsulimonadaceae bacterium]|nr:hypothetical protein [Capsulimonadaceae bacterium]
MSWRRSLGEASNDFVIGKALSDLSFEEWIDFVFNHPVTSPLWYWQDESDWWDAPPTVTVDYLARLFGNASNIFVDFSDAQVAEGLWYLADSSCSDHMLALVNETVPLANRLACIQAIYNLFERCFALKCSPHLSHLDRGDTGTPPEVNPLNLVCYMWFDLIEAYGRSENEHCAEQNNAFLSSMQRSLALDSIACQESALHGLGHWHSDYPDRVESIIDEFLAGHSETTQNLKHYALSARSGSVR